MYRSISGIVASVVLIVGAVQADTWKVDPAHSSVNFSVKHMVISTVRGKFSSFNGEAAWDGKDLSGASITVTADTKSISTDNADRDKHLRSSDFFAADSFPTIAFKSTKVTPVKDGKFTLTGDLTIRGVTKTVTFNAELTGTVNDPWGNARAGFAAEASINRQDFGVKWSQTLDTGGLVVGNEVKITIDMELTKPLAKAEGK
jgi:polyisoprenoid-binding protein YceI